MLPFFLKKSLSVFTDYISIIFFKIQIYRKITYQRKIHLFGKALKVCPSANNDTLLYQEKYKALDSEITKRYIHNTLSMFLLFFCFNQTLDQP